MNERQLVCIMAAIIYAGGDHHQDAAGYTPAGAVGLARTILEAESKARDQIAELDTRTHWPTGEASEGM